MPHPHPTQLAGLLALLLLPAASQSGTAPPAAALPHLVVYGEGGSGTRGMVTFFESVTDAGLCVKRRSTEKDCAFPQQCTSIGNKELDLMLNQTRNTGRPTRLTAAAMNATAPDAYVRAAACLDGVAQLMHAHALRQHGPDYDRGTAVRPPPPPPVLYGAKEPKLMYMAPLLAELWPTTQHVAVVRHPFDACASGNRRQFRRFGASFGSESSCVGFWARIYAGVLDLAETHPGLVRLVRIESLALAAPTAAVETAACLARHVGYAHDSDRAAEAVALMAEHNATYGGRQKRSELLEAHKRDTWLTALHAQANTTEVKAVAARLGYRLEAWGTWAALEEILPAPGAAGFVC